MNSTEIFLDLYRTLEEDLKEFYSGRKVKSSSLVIEYMNGEGRRHYDELDLCREIRNVLSHHSYFKGESPIEPGEKLIEALREVVREVENPVTASSVATPSKELVTSSLSDSIGDVLDKMEKRGFSHVPVVERGRLIGVFSIDAVFGYIKKRGDAFSDRELTLADMRDFLPIGAHKAEAYRICHPRMTLGELTEIFKSSGPSAKRIAAVFVTKDGTSSSNLVGMITPWDVIKAAE